MNEHNQDHDQDIGRDPIAPDDLDMVPDDLDLLITRLIDGDATDEDWNQFRARAAGDIEPWRRLAEDQQVCVALREGFEAVAARALAVELPGSAAGSAAAPHPPVETGEMLRRATPAPASISWGRYVGWAAAVLIGLSWAGTSWRNGSGQTGPQAEGNSSDLIQSVAYDYDQHYAAYLQAPYVVRELDPVLLSSRRTENGLEVTFLRQIAERRYVKGFYEPAWDEQSNPVLRRGDEPRVMRASYKY